MSEPISYGARLRQLAAERPDRPAVTDTVRGVTWRELDMRTNRVARGLLAAGVKHGDLVTLGLPNTVDFIEACYGLWKVGATPQPISHLARALEDGWESLGDIGWFDEEGYLYLADRRTDMILVGGSNVYPAEIEAAVDEHPLVQSSAVIGLPDEDLGSRVHAIVQPRDGLTEEALREHVRTRLVTYKQPRSYEFVDENIRDDAGKVRRTQLRDERARRG